MKKKKLVIILIALVACFAAILSACQTEGNIINPQKYSEQGYHRVYLYYNGGLIDDSAYKAAYVPKGRRLPSPDASDIIESPSRDRHNFIGWYQIDASMLDKREQNKVKYTQDKNGNEIEKQVYDGNGDPVMETIFFVKGHDFTNSLRHDDSLTLMDFEDGIEYEGQPIFIKEWNAEVDKVTEDIALIALWEPRRDYVFVVPEFKFEEFLDETFRSITGLKEYIYNVNSDGSVPKFGRNSPMVPKRENYQIEGFYTDRQCSIPVDYGTNGRYYPNDNSTNIIPIYIKWLEASFRIVEEPSDLFNTDLGGYAIRSSIYMKNNINLAGEKLLVPTRNDEGTGRDIFSGEVRGNGFTISNFRVEIEQGRVIASTSYGAIFGKLESATIRDITFDDITVMFMRSDDASAYDHFMTLNVFAQSINASTVIRNAKVTNLVCYDILATSLNDAYFDVEGSEEPEQVFVTIEGTTKGLRTFTFVEYENKTEDSALIIGQLGEDFGESSANILGCLAEGEYKEWLYNWERWIDEFNYMNVINLPDESNFFGVFLFIGWYDESGNIFDGTKPDDGAEAIRYRAMWA